MRSVFLSAAGPAVVVVVVEACGGGSVLPDLETYPYPVQRVEDMGDRSHFPVGQTFGGYNSNPPTSGPHAATWAPWGVSDLAVPKEVAVHNMEHAGVVVWYNCSGGPEPLDNDACARLRNDLAAIVQATLAEGKSVLMTPYPEMDHRIALTSWNHLDTFDEFDAERVRMFIETFECAFDPEGFCR
jgi:hypothetical protein